MKLVSLKLCLVGTFFQLIALGCMPQKNKDSIGINSKKDTTLIVSIKGKVVFRINNSNFFINKKGTKINTVNEFRGYIPVFFYQKNGEFYIPNRLDNLIYKINASGLIVDRILLQDEFEIAQFYITNNDEKYIVNANKGMVFYSRTNERVYNDSNVKKLILDIPNDNLMICKSYNTESYTFTDTKKIITEPLIWDAHYCDFYFEDKTLSVMCYEGFTHENLKDHFIVLKKYDLPKLKLLSVDSFAVECKTCFDLPKLLSKNLIVATNFNKPDKPVSELILLRSMNMKRVELISPINTEPLVDPLYGGLMFQFAFSLNEEKMKLYALATTEKEVVMIEYDIPESFR